MRDRAGDAGHPALTRRPGRSSRQAEKAAAGRETQAADGQDRAAARARPWPGRRDRRSTRSRPARLAALDDHTGRCAGTVHCGGRAGRDRRRPRQAVAGARRGGPGRPAGGPRRPAPGCGTAEERLREAWRGLRPGRATGSPRWPRRRPTATTSSARGRRCGRGPTRPRAERAGVRDAVRGGGRGGAGRDHRRWSAELDDPLRRAGVAAGPAGRRPGRLPAGRRARRRAGHRRARSGWWSGGSRPPGWSSRSPQHEREAQVAKSLALHLRANQFERWLLTEALDALVAGASRILRELSSGQYDLAHDKGEFLVIDHADAGPASRRCGRCPAVRRSRPRWPWRWRCPSSSPGCPRRRRSLESIMLDEGFGTLDADHAGHGRGDAGEPGRPGRPDGRRGHPRRRRWPNASRSGSR